MGMWRYPIKEFTKGQDRLQEIFKYNRYIDERGD